MRQKDSLSLTLSQMSTSAQQEIRTINLLRRKKNGNKRRSSHLEQIMSKSIIINDMTPRAVGRVYICANFLRSFCWTRARVMLKRKSCSMRKYYKSSSPSYSNMLYITVWQLIRHHPNRAGPRLCKCKVGRPCPLVLLRYLFRERERSSSFGKPAAATEQVSCQIANIPMMVIAPFGIIGKKHSQDKLSNRPWSSDKSSTKREVAGIHLCPCDSSRIMCTTRGSLIFFFSTGSQLGRPSWKKAFTRLVRRSYLLSKVEWRQ